jgi:hypothetical protein
MKREIDTRQLIYDLVHLYDDDRIMERSRLNNNRGVLSVGSGEEIPLAVALLCTHKDDVWDEIDQQPIVQLDVSMNRANFKDLVFE